MKIGTKVEFTRRNGEVAQGRVSSEPYAYSKGEWIDVNVGDKKAPKIIKVRPSQLSRVR